MSLIRQSREEKKALAALRAQKRLEQRFEYIDWEFDELYPLQERLKAGTAHIDLELTAGDVVIIDEEESGGQDSDQTDA